MLKMAFAGFRHGHIYDFYKMALANEETQIVGAFEQDSATRADVEKALGVNFTYSTYEELLSDNNVDCVVIGDYFAIRGSRAIAALKAGKHVFADKPLCTLRSELDEIEALSKKNDLKVGCMLDLRYFPFVQYVRELLTSGKLGNVRTIYFGGQHPLMYGTRASWYFEEGKHGGVINDIAIHGIDLIHHITGGLEPTRTLGARTWNGYAEAEPHFKDCGHFMLEMTGGAGLLADVSYSSPNSIGYWVPHYWRFTICAAKGTVEFGVNLKEVRIALDGREGVEYIIPPPVDTGNCLSVFLKEIAGEKTDIDTEIVIKSSRNTLLIQEAADNG